MKESFEIFMQQLEEGIRGNDSERHSLKRAARNIQVVEKAVIEFEGMHLMVTGFSPDEAGDIAFDEVYLPKLYGKLLLFKKQYELENQRLHSTPKQYEEYRESELKKIKRFYTQYQRFCQQYYSGSLDDKGLFHPLDARDHQLRELENLLPAKTDPGTLLLSCLLAYEEYRATLLDQPPGEEPVAPAVKVTYRGKIIDLIELGMAVYASKDIYVNGKPATQEFIRKSLEQLFNVKIDGWSTRVAQMGDRKNDQTKKLDDMKRKLETYLDKRLLGETDD